MAGAKTPSFPREENCPRDLTRNLGWMGASTAWEGWILTCTARRVKHEGITTEEEEEDC